MLSIVKALFLLWDVTMGDVSVMPCSESLGGSASISMLPCSLASYLSRVPVMIWDFDTRSTVRALTGHVQTVTAVRWDI